MKYSILLLGIIIIASCGTKVLDGYTDKVSYLPNENIEVFLNAESKSNTKLSLFDINGNVVESINAEVEIQPKVDTNTWYEMGYQYNKTVDFSPSHLTSGIYYFENSSPFIVKNPAKKNDVLIVYPSNTDNAYNRNGGRSSYTKPKGDILSFKRPVGIHSYAENFLKWLPKQGFNVDYICDRDMDEYDNIKNYKVVIVPGHSEYWTRKARRNFDRFVEEGGDAIVLSGNTMWWQVRYEEDKMICMKVPELDSLVPDSLISTNWTFDLLKYQTINSIGADFNRGGYGLKEDSGWDGYKIINSSPLFANTTIQKGDILSLPSAEYDGLPIHFINNLPVLDTAIIKFYKHKILGFDKGYRALETYGTFVVFQKTKTSGVIINTASTNWCSDGFSGKDSEKIKKLTYNFIDFLLRDESVF